MNEQTLKLEVDAKQASQDLAAVIESTTPPLWRIQLVRILQLVGIIGGFLGGADFLQIMPLFPPDFAAWLLVAGPTFAAASKPLILFLGDWLDDGVKNDSFKIPLALFLVAIVTLTASLGLVGCSGLTFTLSTPYGDASGSPDGSGTVTLRPIIIPDRSGK